MSDISATLAQPRSFDAITRGDLRRLWPWFAPYSLTIALALLCAVLAALSAIMVPVVVSRVIIDDLLLGGSLGNAPDYGQYALCQILAAQTGLPLLAAAILVDALWIALSGLFAYGFTTQLARTTTFALRDLRLALFRHIEHLPSAFHDRVKAGQLLTRLTTDVESLSDLLAGFGTLSGQILPFFIALFVMFASDVRLTLEVLPLLPIVAVINFYFRRITAKIYPNTRTSVARINEHLNENLSGIEIVQLAGRQARNLSVFTKLIGATRHWESRAIYFETIFLPVFENLSYVAMGCILLFGGLHVLSGLTSVGTIVLFIQLSDLLFRPVITLGDQANVLYRALPAAERIFHLLDWKEELRVPENPKPLPNSLRGQIVLCDLSFRYEIGAPVLKNINLTIAPGEVIAIVGQTGSGKTTLCRLICRFYDLSPGMMFVDGVDIMDVAPSDIRRRVGVILQDFHIFRGSVLENITLGNPAITYNDVVAAARLVHALPFIEALPEGFHTLLSHGGENISQGQRQLLVFARAVAWNPEILILDEATANIDSQTERLIQSALHEVMRGRTTIVIAHRLQTIRNANRIVVLDHGEIVEVGNHKALIDKDGAYKKLYDLQSGGDD